MKLLSLVTVFIAAGSVSPFAPAKVVPQSHVRTNMAADAADDEEYYINEERRFLLNLILVGSATLTVGAIGVPYFAFFVPPVVEGGPGETSAQDVLGNDLFAKPYLHSKPAGDRSLALGLKGDPTYLIVKDDKTLESYGLNAVCTHLGCIVPWSALNNKFMCPCHGSQYDPTGVVVRGPAPLPLALAHCDTAKDGKILFSPWTEDDFRTGEKGWWN
jgi:cytochrome b6-f complex iron-sulfur subunit